MLQDYTEQRRGLEAEVEDEDLSVPISKPVYIYYKLFDKNGPCNTRHPIDPNNPFIGRVDTTLVPPPHTVASLAQFICGKENKGFGYDMDTGDLYTTELFKTITSNKSFNLDELLPLLGNGRPGSRPQEPVILKVGYHEI